MSGKHRPRVAFVYPPYGPPNLPSLGLAILSAFAKSRGFECRTFFWHYRFALMLPGATMQQKLKVYELMTQREFFPWNEWIFTRYILHDQMARRDADVLNRLSLLDAVSANIVAAGLTGNVTPSQLVLYLCNNTGYILSAMADELAGYDVIGIASTFFQNGPAIALAKCIKDRWPGKITVFGGANCDGEMGRALIESFPFLDYVFSGEVDYSFPEFLDSIHQGKSVGHIPGLLYRTSEGHVAEGPKAEPVTDMNGLPIPDFDDYVAERKKLGLFKPEDLCLPLESSRGCWWGAKAHCTFCGLNANGMGYRQKEYERFRGEVETVVERYKPRYLFMADNILSMKYFKDFVQWAKQKNIAVDFFYEIKANLSRKQVEDLADAGITMVQPGIESFSSKILALMKKGLRGIQNVAFLKYAADYGLISAYSILGGFPGEDPLEYERMARQLPKLVHFRPPNGVVDIEFHRFSPYHSRPSEFGIRLKPSWRYSYIYPFPEETLARIAYLFELQGRTALDLSYMRPLAHIVAKWRELFDATNCALTWSEREGGILVKDRRPGFAACNYLISGHAAYVYRLLDEPRPLRAAVRDTVRISATKSQPTPRPQAKASPEALYRTPFSPYGFPAVATLYATRVAERTISFTGAEFADNPEACVQPLVDAGILYEDNGWYVTLPVMENFRQIKLGWSNAGI
jgi:ribosomal peptide maturation radical SAM protein 1